MQKTYLMMPSHAKVTWPTHVKNQYEFWKKSLSSLHLIRSPLFRKCLLKTCCSARLCDVTNGSNASPSLLATSPDWSYFPKVWYLFCFCLSFISLSRAEQAVNKGLNLLHLGDRQFDFCETFARQTPVPFPVSPLSFFLSRKGLLLHKQEVLFFPPRLWLHLWEVSTAVKGTNTKTQKQNKTKKHITQCRKSQVTQFTYNRASIYRKFHDISGQTRWLISLGPQT